MLCINSFYRCTRRRIPCALLTVGTCFSLSLVRSDSTVFVRKVVSIDYRNGCIIDHFGCSHLMMSSRFVYICVPR